MPSVKVALPGSRVPIGRTKSGELVYIDSQYWEFMRALHLRSGGDTVDKVEVAASAGETATTAAATAQAAAVAAQTAADSVATDVSVQALQLSGVSNNCTIVGSDTGAAARIAINSHTRYYADGTSVSVTGNNVSSLSYDTMYWVYYDDASRAGGAVSYAVTTDPNNAQPTSLNPDRHYVGSCRTPIATDPPTDGDPNFYA